MNVPKNFLPNKEYTFEELKKRKRGKKKRVKNIEDFVLEPEDVGSENIVSIKHITRERLAYNGPHIRWGDFSDSIRIIYGGSVPSINVFEFNSEDLIKKRIKNIYEEGESGNWIYDRRALIVEKYVLILQGNHESKKEMNNMEKAYRRMFGAKRLVKREYLELK